MRITTYILVPKKKLTLTDLFENLFEVIYSTFIPVIGAYGFFISKNAIFLTLIILPIFIKFKLEPKQEKIYKNMIKERIPR